MLPSLSCHCGRNTNGLSSPTLPSQCSLLAITFQSFRFDLMLQRPGLHSVPYWLYFPLCLPSEILATISHILLKIKNPRPQFKILNYLSSKVTHCHCTSVSLYLEDEIIYPSTYPTGLLSQRNWSLWIWMPEKLCFDSYNESYIPDLPLMNYMTSSKSFCEILSPVFCS